MDSLRDEIEQEMKILNLDKRRLCNLLLKVLDASGSVSYTHLRAHET